MVLPTLPTTTSFPTLLVLRLLARALSPICTFPFVSLPAFAMVLPTLPTTRGVTTLPTNLPTNSPTNSPTTTPTTAVTTKKTRMPVKIWKQPSFLLLVLAVVVVNFQNDGDHETTTDESYEQARQHDDRFSLFLSIHNILPASPFHKIFSVGHRISPYYTYGLEPTIAAKAAAAAISLGAAQPPTVFDPATSLACGLRKKPRLTSLIRYDAFAGFKRRVAGTPSPLWTPMADSAGFGGKLRVRASDMSSLALHFMTPARHFTPTAASPSQPLRPLRLHSSSTSGSPSSPRFRPPPRRPRPDTTFIFSGPLIAMVTGMVYVASMVSSMYSGGGDIYIHKHIY
jgi:hypothetical protein